MGAELVRETLARTSRKLEYLAMVAVDSVTPPRCAICKANLAFGRRSPFRERPLDSILCRSCRKLLATPPERFCPICAAPIDEGETCLAPHQRIYYDEIRPLNLYLGTARTLAIVMKRSTNRRLAAMVAKLYREERRDQLEKFKPTCVVAVPMHWKRQFFSRGGLNGPAKVARELAKALKIPCLAHNIRRVRNTPQQTTVSWFKRPDNVCDAFAVHDPDKTQPFKGQRVVVVDDAFTSGATTNEIARTLKRADADAVWGAPITRAGLDFIEKLKREGERLRDSYTGWAPSEADDDLHYYSL